MESKRGWRAPGFVPRARRLLVATAVLLGALPTAARAQDDPWGDHRPVVSPDGRTLAFMSNRTGTWSVYTMPLDGSHPPERVSDDPRGEWYPDWSPDGSTLVYHRYAGEGDQRFLRLYDVATGRESVLGAADGDRSYARWARDGTSVYYKCSPGICRMALDGRELGVVTGLGGGQHDPSVSPDGQWIAYVDPLDGEQDAFLRRLDGGDTLRLTNDAGSTYGLDWSPDGRWLCFNTEIDGNSDIWLYDTNTRERRRLTTHEAWEHLPRWAPDGSYVLFTSERSGGERIYRMRLDGTGLELVDTGGH